MGEPARIPSAPGAILAKAFRDSWPHIVVVTLAMCVTSVSMALIPWALGRVLDSGIDDGLNAGILPGLAILAGLTGLAALTGFNEVACAAIVERGMWITGRRLIRVVFGRRTDVGRDVPSGDIVTSIVTDGNRVGMLLAFVAELISSVVAFGVVVVLMVRISVPLGLFVAIGTPILMALTGWVVKPMQKRLAEQREATGVLTSLASDGVAGLRVLRGLGGEDLFNDRYAAQSGRVLEAGLRAARYRAMLHVVATAGPAAFTAIVVGGGLWLTFDGQMRPGQLVAFYGFTAYLQLPIESLANCVYLAARAWTAAGKISTILAARYLVSDARVDAGLPPRDWGATCLTDAASGVRITPGVITALVAAAPEDSAAIAARLARTDDSALVLADDVDLRRYPVDDVRRNIVYSGPIAELFMGTLRSNLLGPDAEPIEPRPVAQQVADILRPGGEIRPVLAETPGARPADPRLNAALEVADARDVLSSIDGGLDGDIAERGRSISGGQRQRVALARALALDAPITILVEPTSAVDSHTESRIAVRLAECRAGRTTVIATTSPLVLASCDEVVFLVGGRQAARGTHRELAADADYLAVVHRGEVEPAGDARVEDSASSGGAGPGGSSPGRDPAGESSQNPAGESSQNPAREPSHNAAGESSHNAAGEPNREPSPLPGQESSPAHSPLPSREGGDR